MINILLKIFLYFSVFLISSSVFSASFDCKKAKSLVEKTICGDASLSKLDERLLEAYKFALSSHPVQGYVRTRQREWIKENNECPRDSILKCLKNRYENKIFWLENTKIIQIYANTKKYDYSDGDLVVEIIKNNNNYRLSLWGGFRIHRQATNDSGKPVYLGCAFEGTTTSPDSGMATGATGEKLIFRMSTTEIIFDDDRQNCEGFGSLPDRLLKVQ
jgi:uncharacterized protein